jgi:hypothetical protein
MAVFRRSVRSPARIGWKCRRLRDREELKSRAAARPKAEITMSSGNHPYRNKTAMKRAILCFLTILVACEWVAPRAVAAQKKQTPAAPAAVFTATPVKSAFSEGEAILLLVGLKNTGTQTIVADARFALGPTVQASISGPQGKTVDWAASFEAGVPGFQTVRPGNQITRVVCLNCGARDPFAYPFAEPGTYTVRLAYAASSVTPAERASFPQAATLEHSIEAAPFEVQVTTPVLRFSARPAQAVFHVGDPITFHFRLENTGRQGVLAAYDLPLEGAVRLRVTDSSGNRVPVSGQPPSGQSLLSTIDAGSAIEASYPITPVNLYGAIVQGFDIRQPGTYTVQAIYDLAQPIDVLRGYVGVLPVLIVPGPLVAPPVQITLEPPAPASQD